MRARNDKAHERLARALEGDPTLEASARALSPELATRLAAGVQARIASQRRLIAAEAAALLGSFAACALLGLWVGWTAPNAAPAPTLLAALQITAIADPAP